jgi:UDP-glucose 4-epimerase
MNRYIKMGTQKGGNSMNWKNKKVLVTGGASFISSHLVDRLVELGAEVRVADDLSSGRLENLERSQDKIEFLKGDLINSDFAKKTVRDIDVVFHLAASHGGRGYIDTHPANCASNMVLDGMMFRAANEAGVERVCFASSACVYPTNLQVKRKEGSVIWLSEDMVDLFQPGKALADGEYGWAKLMGEMALRAYHKQFGLKASCCRIFTAYGERENETHAVIALIAKAFIRQDPYKIWGTGEQDRNFTYVGDIVEGMIRSAERIEDGSSINLGTAEHVKVKEIAEKIFKMIEWKPSKIFFDTSKPEGVFSRAADLTNAKKLLKWEPQTTIDDGLSRTIEWYFATHDREEVARDFERRLMER